MAIREKSQKVPVLLDNPDLIKPFEMMVTGFGVPEYTSVDPTLFVAISFLLMFGAMFGDIGQGLVLFAAGIILTKQHRSLLSRVGFLMTYCGAAATVFGLLYGDFFGMEGIMPSLWMNPFHNISSFLPLAVALGIVLISLGIVINIINAVRAKEVSKVIFGKTGLIGGLIYWTGIALGLRYFVFKAGPLPLVLIVLLVGGPVFLLFLRAPVDKILSKRGRMFQEGFLTYFIETVIEVMEIFTGYLANTLSYIRVAAFALAHAGLFLAVFTLADLVKSTAMGSVGSILVVILGNIFIFVFEGMIVTIQGIRLEYYEFFSKFFEGEGKLYRPVGFGLQY
jgi:V/A-type H+-transporting ATPase subunit I